MRKAPLLTLVETPFFTKVRQGLLSDDAYRLAQVALAMNPELAP